MVRPVTKKNEESAVWPVKPRRITPEEIATARAIVQRASDRARKRRLHGRRRIWPVAAE